MDISGSAAIVTGGASGLGAATARALVDGGAVVTLIDLNTADGEAISSELGGRTRFVQADVTDPDTIAAAISLVGEYAPLRVLGRLLLKPIQLGPFLSNNLPLPYELYAGRPDRASVNGSVHWHQHGAPVGA